MLACTVVCYLGQEVCDGRPAKGRPLISALILAFCRAILILNTSYYIGLPISEA